MLNVEFLYVWFINVQCHTKDTLHIWQQRKLRSACSLRPIKISTFTSSRIHRFYKRKYRPEHSLCSSWETDTLLRETTLKIGFFLPSEKVFTLNGKNLLQMEQFFPFREDPLFKKGLVYRKCKQEVTKLSPLAEIYIWKKQVYTVPLKRPFMQDTLL